MRYLRSVAHQIHRTLGVAMTDLVRVTTPAGQIDATAVSIARQAARVVTSREIETTRLRTGADDG